MRKSQREAIGRGQSERFRRQREEFPYPRQGRKRCSACRKMLNFDLDDLPHSQFGRHMNKLVDGTITERPQSECRQCTKDRAARYREKLREEGRLRDMRRKWDASRDREHVRQYQREWAATKRRKQGVPPRKWRKYDETGPLLPVAPFSEFLQEYMKDQRVSVGQLAKIAHVNPNRVRRILNQRDTNGSEIKSISLASVDQISVAIDHPEIPALLYSDK